MLHLRSSTRKLKLTVNWRMVGKQEVTRFLPVCPLEEAAHNGQTTLAQQWETVCPFIAHGLSRMRSVTHAC